MKTLPAGQIHRLLSQVEDIFQRLEFPPSPLRVEKTSLAIYTSMGAPRRQFHTLDHIFSFTTEDPLLGIAALFHDVVYLSIDLAWPVAFSSELEAVAGTGAPGTRLALESSIPHYAEVLKVFGQEPGGTLSGTGINEIASALCLASSLGQELGLNRVLAAAACIELTIPFRGSGAAQALFQRLRDLGLREAEAEIMVKRGLKMASQDVSDFKLDSTAAFLAGTWRLLPELNPDLRVSEHYTVTSYRKALQGMAGFFGFLKAEMIFESWRNEPEEETLQTWLVRARTNLTSAREYLQIKILAATLLEAFALVTGGDAPLPFFMGGATSADYGTDRLEKHLPTLPKATRRTEILELLDKGREGETSFDLKNSPLAAFLYRKLTEADLSQEVERYTNFHSGKLTPCEYLRECPTKLRTPVAQALSEFVTTRKDLLAPWL